MSVFDIHYGSLLLWGSFATTVLTLIMYISQGMGLSRMSLPFMIGTLFTPNRDKAQIFGLIGNFVIGWLFTLLYAMLFESVGWATWWLGMIFGLVHGLFILTVAMPVMPHLHPRMANEHDGPAPTNMLEPPGFMAFHYGRRTPLMTLIAHLTFGGIIGGFYTITIG